MHLPIYRFHILGYGGTIVTKSDKGKQKFGGEVGIEAKM